MKSARHKLLFVDDIEELCRLVRTLLEKNGFEVRVAHTGQSAQSLLALEEFSAIISDINLPGGINGIALLQYVLENYPLVPVVLTTGYAKDSDTEKAFSLGAKAILAKPFKIDDILRILKESCCIESLKV